VVVDLRQAREMLEQVILHHHHHLKEILEDQPLVVAVAVPVVLVLLVVLVDQMVLVVLDHRFQSKLTQQKLMLLVVQVANTPLMNMELLQLEMEEILNSMPVEKMVDQVS
tara:strand:- start:73 stop:402 length:330 start_codon:yes stop_codon:yes gene_type:complete